MKKLIVIILALALILPAAALADQDPIVGYWYMYLDGKASPEIMKNLGDYESVLDMYLFAEDGTVMLLENAVKDGSATPRFVSQGKWEKNLFSYNYSIIGLGEGKLSVKNDDIELELPDMNGIKLRLRRIVRFDPYKDYFY